MDYWPFAGRHDNACVETAQNPAFVDAKGSHAAPMHNELIGHSSSDRHAMVHPCLTHVVSPAARQSPDEQRESTTACRPVVTPMNEARTCGVQGANQSASTGAVAETQVPAVMSQRR